MRIGANIGIPQRRHPGEYGPPLSVPVITGSPTISGDAVVGSTFTASPASVSGNPSPTRTWQWQRNDGSWGDISGATSDTYVIVTEDVGHQLRVTQTETNTEGSDSATSGASGQPVFADRVLFGGDQLVFDGKVVVHEGGDGTNTLTITGGDGINVTDDETEVTVEAA